MTRRIENVTVVQIPVIRRVEKTTRTTSTMSKKWLKASMFAAPSIPNTSMQQRGVMARSTILERNARTSFSMTQDRV